MQFGQLYKNGIWIMIWKENLKSVEAEARQDIRKGTAWPMVKLTEERVRGWEELHFE